jgi:glycosyltransferase involved in cell wall biosynthesis
VGEISDNENDEFLRNAYALFLPLDWPGPFALVVIEAIAYGTPVIAYCRGSIPEVIEDGVTGVIIDGLEAAIRTVEHIPTLSRNHRRRLFEPRFSVARLAEDYLTVDQRPIESKLTPIYAEKGGSLGRRHSRGRSILHSGHFFSG